MFRTKRFQTLALAVGVSLTGLALAGCGDSDAAEAKDADETTRALTVRVETVTPRSITDAIQVVGILKAYDDVMISAEEGGVVRTWVVDKGERVTRGTTIAVMKDDVIEAQYNGALSQYRMAELNLEKQEKVYKENGISELQYKNLVYARDAAKANADLMKARLGRTRITAPVDGVLEQQYADEGEFTPPGAPLAHVVSTSKLKVQAEIPEKHVGRVSVGNTVFMTFDAYPGDTVTASVSYVGATVDASNRSLLVEIVIPSKNGRYKPEMIAKVRVLREAKENALVVSENSVQLIDMNTYVLFVEQDGVAHQRTVQIGARENSHIEISSGLEPGDRVIVTDVQKLVDGLRVNVVG